MLFYGYLNSTYSSRKIAKAITENIYLMWLSGGLQPDFRGQKLKGTLDKLFSQLVLMMVYLEIISLEKQFVDGTKIEHNSHKIFCLEKIAREKQNQTRVKINTEL